MLGKAGKAPGPSGMVVEMIRAAGDMGASKIRDLAAAIICDGKVPSDWEQSFIVCLYKGKGYALDRGNYHGLKLTEQVMTVLERIVDSFSRQVVSIDDSQFGLSQVETQQMQSLSSGSCKKSISLPTRDFTWLLWILRRHLTLKVIWWALRKHSVDEWIVCLVQGMYSNARSRVHVGDGYSEEFQVKLGGHQGSLLSLLLFIIVLEALSREFPWEDLYADELVIIAESLEE